MTSASRVEFHSEADEEVIAARRWYEEREPMLGRLFEADLERTLARIQEKPLAWPALDAQTRKASLRQFPFLVVFRVATNVIQVVAVAHTSRRPLYWRSRRLH